MNKGALTSVNDVDPYIIIINLLDSIFNLLPAVICRREIQTHTGHFFSKVGNKEYDVLWFVELMDDHSRKPKNLFI
jgi:hypothetical protein